MTAPTRAALTEAATGAARLANTLGRMAEHADSHRDQTMALAMSSFANRCTDIAADLRAAAGLIDPAPPAEGDPHEDPR